MNFEQDGFTAYAGFSRPKHLDFVSWAIIRFQANQTPGAKFSHCFPVFRIGVGPVIMDANKGKKIQIVPLKKKCEKNYIELLKFPTNPERFKAALEEICRFEGEDYGTLQLIGQIFPTLGICKNPFDKDKICSELLAIFILNAVDDSPRGKQIEESILEIGIDEIRPAQIYKILSV